jgi:AraC family transcriptional activator FtrA
LAQSQLHRPIDVDDLAKKAATNPRTLHRRFAASVGLSPALWLSPQRLSRARDLMETTKLSLLLIAEKCGFSGIETFRVAFRRQIGMAPAQYRRQYSQKPISP